MRTEKTLGFAQFGAAMSSGDWHLFSVIYLATYKMIAPELAEQLWVTLRVRRIVRCGGVATCQQVREKYPLQKRLLKARRWFVMDRLKALIRNGFVERRKDTDGALYYRLTPKGVKRLETGKIASRHSC